MEIVDPKVLADTYVAAMEKLVAYRTARQEYLDHKVEADASAARTSKAFGKASKLWDEFVKIQRRVEKLGQTIRGDANVELPPDEAQDLIDQLRGKE